MNGTTSPSLANAFVWMSQRTPRLSVHFADIRQSSCSHHPARFCRSGVRRPLWMPMLKLVTHGLIALKFHLSALNGSGNQSWNCAGVGAVGSPAGRPVAVYVLRQRVQLALISVWE